MVTTYIDPSGEIITPIIIGGIVIWVWVWGDAGVANAPAPGDELVSNEQGKGERMGSIAGTVAVAGSGAVTGIGKGYLRRKAANLARKKAAEKLASEWEKATAYPSNGCPQPAGPTDYGNPLGLPPEAFIPGMPPVKRPPRFK